MHRGGDAPEPFLVLHRFMWERLGLSGVPLLVYARIYGFCKNGGEFYESRRNTAAYLCTTQRSVTRAVGELAARGLIVETGERVFPNGGATRCYAVDFAAAGICGAGAGGDGASGGDGLSGGDGASGGVAGRGDAPSGGRSPGAPASGRNPDGTVGDPVTGVHPKGKGGQSVE